MSSRANAMPSEMARARIMATPDDNERDAVVALVSGASLEMSPRERDAIVPAAEFLRPDTEVYISSPPSVSHHEIVSAAVTLRRFGLEPVPHIAARALVGFTQLNDLLARAAGEAGVRRALVIGGDLDPPAGPFHASLDVLSLGLFEKYGFTRIGLAAYPEGHPRIAAAALDRALTVKLALLRQAGIETQVVTQFVFDAAPVLHWLTAMRQRDPSFAVHIGLAGPASIATLARYAVRCGIGHSIGALVHHGTSIARLVAEAGPEHVVRQLAAAGGRQDGIDGIHLFGFGGLTRTARWLSAVARGEFRLTADGAGFTVND
jgi:methylenetetrahydrofolate reductase (NADPH)